MSIFEGQSMDALVLAVLLLLVPVFCSTASNNETEEQYRYLCPKNFRNVGKKCYHFSNNTGTWFQAYFSCQDLGESNFTVFTDRYDQRQLEQFLFRNRSRNRGHNPNNVFWVGGFKDWKQKKWIYTDGSLMQYPTLEEIHLSEEDNWTCLLIDGNRRRWRAENCMERRRFICESKAVASVVMRVLDKKVKRKITIDECISSAGALTKKQRRKCMKLLNGGEGRERIDDDDPAAVIQQAKPAYPTQPTVVRAISHICPQNWMSLGNQCYLFSKEKVTWSDAHFNCGQINAKLAMIRTKSQDQKLRIFLNGFTEKQERWIGGRFNGKIREWIWALNGKPLHYNGFVEGPYGNSTDGLDWRAIVMDPKYGYRWTHRNEMERHLYICQVKGRAVKRLNYPRRPAATIQIIPDQRRSHQDHRIRSSRRANRNKRM